MPFTNAGAQRMLNALLAGDQYAHLHADTPATTDNVVTGTAYAGVQVTDWDAEVDGAVRRRTNDGAVRFPTPGGAWSRAGAIAIWDRQNIAPNPADPPGLLRAARLSPGFELALNDSLSFADASIAIAIEVTD